MEVAFNHRHCGHRCPLGRTFHAPGNLGAGLGSWDSTSEKRGRGEFMALENVENLKEASVGENAMRSTSRQFES